MGERPHAALQKFFVHDLTDREEVWGVEVWPEHRVQVSASRFRVPVACLTRQETAYEEIIVTPPLLCIEVLSSEDRMGRIQERVDDYFAMGVKAVWVVDPWTRTLLSANDGGPLLPAGAALTVLGTEIRVSSSDLLGRLDRLERRG